MSARVLGWSDQSGFKVTPTSSFRLRKFTCVSHRHTHTHTPQKISHVSKLLCVCMYNTKNPHTQINALPTLTHTHHIPNVMHHLESGEQRWASTGKYWKYLFLSTDERDIILQIYLVVLWICCRLICMTTHYLSLRAQRQLQRRYHLYYYWAIMWRYTERGNWAS